MSDFTIKNLMDVDDSAGDRAPDVEARFGRKHLDSEHLGVSYFRYAPGFHSTGGHSHREQEEAYLVVGGSGRIKLKLPPMQPSQVEILGEGPEAAPKVVDLLERLGVTA